MSGPWGGVLDAGKDGLWQGQPATNTTQITSDHSFRPPWDSKHHPSPTRARLFTRVDDVGKVYHLMRQIQKDTS